MCEKLRFELKSDKENQKNSFIPSGMPRPLAIGILLVLFCLVVVGSLLVLGIFLKIQFLISFASRLGLVVSVLAFIFMVLFNWKKGG